MKRSHKKLCAALLSLVLTSSTLSVSAYADKLKISEGIVYRYTDDNQKVGVYTGWAKTSAGKRYYRNGILLKNAVIRLSDKKRYCFGSDGYMVTGWKKFGKGWHYFDESGTEVIGDVSINGKDFFFSDSGVWDGKGTLDISEVSISVKKKIPSGIFGGLYNDGGMIVVLSTDTEKAEQIISELYPNEVGIYVKRCIFTQRYLSQVKEKILQNKIGSGVYTDVINNRVAVEYTDDLEEVRQFLKDNGFEACVRLEHTSGKVILD